MNFPSGSRNRRMAAVLTLLVAGMVGLSYAAVPLYRIFCQVTGYGGTTQVAERGADQVFDRIIEVRFNTDRAKDLPWSFKPSKRAIRVHVGETTLAYFEADNHGDRRITGSAIYNVTPLKAGPYFKKIECFCFTEQTLESGAHADMPVSFFIDPEILDDDELDDVGTITLSYTFYRRPDPADGKPDTTAAAPTTSDKSGAD